TYAGTGAPPSECHSSAQSKCGAFFPPKDSRSGQRPEANPARLGPQLLSVCHPDVEADPRAPLRTVPLGHRFQSDLPSTRPTGAHPREGGPHRDRSYPGPPTERHASDDHIGTLPNAESHLADQEQSWESLQGKVVSCFMKSQTATRRNYLCRYFTL